MRTSPVPVITVKDGGKPVVRNIAFPLETENQEELVMRVKQLQDFLQASIHVVWINTPANFTSDTRTYERLRSFAKRFMLSNYTINVFSHPNEEGGIIAFARAAKRT